MVREKEEREREREEGAGEAGMELAELVGDVAGEPFDATAPEFAAIVRRRAED